MTTIILGQHVQCAITGYHGITHQRRESLNGNVQYAVQPRNKDDENTLPESHYIDHHLLEVLDAGVSDRRTEPTAERIELGSKVRDTVTGLEGVATARATFLNGCVYYDLTPMKATKMFDSNPEAQFIEAGRLEVIRAKAVVEAEPPKLKPPGGPSMKVARQAVSRG